MTTRLKRWPRSSASITPTTCGLQPRRMNDMLAYQLRGLYAVAAEIGEDVNNPEGGLTLDTAEDDIIEIIVDCANGLPHKLGIEDPGILTAHQRERVLECFYEAARKTNQGD